MGNTHREITWYGFFVLLLVAHWPGSYIKQPSYGDDNVPFHDHKPSTQFIHISDNQGASTDITMIDISPHSAEITPNPDL